MADHRFFAAMYDRVLAKSETRGLADHRHRLLATAHGRVLEIGAGTGLNLSHYRPEQVSSLVALEPDGAMRRRLSARAGEATVPFEVVAAGVDDADLPEGGFDTVVATLVFCSVADPEAAAESVHHWLKPGGQLLFLEHVRAIGLRGAVQQAATPVWSLAVGGCHLDRRTLDTLNGSRCRPADRCSGRVCRAWPGGGRSAIPAMWHPSSPSPRVEESDDVYRPPRAAGPDRRRRVAGALQLRRRPAGGQRRQ